MKRRIIAKPLGSRWGVYDTARGSWPHQVTTFGKVKQDHPSEEAAEAEADRLDRFYRGDA